MTSAVTICGRTESKLEDAAKKIEAAAGHGGSVQYIVADVTAEEDVLDPPPTALFTLKYSAPK